MASVTVTLTGYSKVDNERIRWEDNKLLGTTFAYLSREPQYLNTLTMFYAGSSTGWVFMDMAAANKDFTPAFEATGRIIFEASDGQTLEIMIANADTTEPYNWRPSNFAAVSAFASHVVGLADHDVTLTLTDDSATNRAPVITAIAADPTTIDEGGVVTLTATVTDPDIT